MTEVIKPPVSDSAFGALSLPDLALTSEEARRLVRERDHLLLLHESLGEVERAPSLEARLRVFVRAIQRIGFGRVTITLRDAELEPTLIVCVGLSADEERELREAPAPGSVWCERLTALETSEDLAPLRVSQSFYLDARNQWVADEFGRDALRSALDAPGQASDWTPQDALLVPLRSPEGRVLATLVLDDPDERARPSLTRVRTVELFGQQVAAMIEHSRLYDESLRERRVNEALADVARAVNESLRLHEVVDRILRHARPLFRVEGAMLGLRRGEVVEVIAATGVGAPMLERAVPVRGSVLGHVVREGVAVIANDAANDPEVHPSMVERTHVSRMLAVPLISATGTIGALALLNRDLHFTEEDASVLQRLADQAAIAVANAQLFERHHALSERYRKVVETTRDGIVLVDRDGRLTFANPAALELFQLDESEIGMSAERLLAPEHRGDMAERKARFHSGQPQRYESTIVRGDGERRTVAVSTSPLREMGEVTGILASLRDITDERRARDAVMQSEARYRNLFETATDPIYTLDSSGCFTSVNEATCLASGVRASELLGCSATAFVAEDDRESAKQHFAAALSGEARRYECALIRPDGERRLLSVTNSPIRHGSRVIGVLGIARDITEARAHAQALTRSEARYTRLLESAADAVFTVDLDGRLTSVNQSLERAVGRSRRELVGMPLGTLVDPRDEAAVWMLVQETFTGRRRRGELRYLSAEGELRHGSILTSPILEDDELTGALAIVRDTTEERRLAGQLLQQEKLAAVGQLVSGVAHELNNPLAGVMAFSQLLLSDTMDCETDRRRAIETIHDEARRAARIVANLLTFARQRAPERTVTDLNRVVSDVLELRSYSHRVQRVEVETSLDPSLPLTWADPFQLQQVLLNILGNAEHALADWTGERRLHVSTGNSGGMLRVSVADSGPGIAPEHLSRVFDPFFTTKQVGEGTGLGLSISDGIVREHGGRIRVESQDGAGATFVLEIPFIPPQDATLIPQVASEPAAPPASRRVLVVDDEPAICSAVRSYISRLGHEVDVAPGGREALVLLEGCRYDAVLLDVRMPDLSGDQLFRELHARDPRQAARVVFVTGDTQSAATSAFLVETGRPVVRKPFLLDELAAVVLNEAAAESVA